MKYASDFRSIARDALRGRWGIAVIAGLIASLLGAVASSGPEVKFNFSDNGANVNLMFANQEIYSSSGGWLPELNAFIVGGAIYIMIAALIMAAVFFVLGSVISLATPDSIWISLTAVRNLISVLCLASFLTGRTQPSQSFWKPSM